MPDMTPEQIEAEHLRLRLLVAANVVERDDIQAMMRLLTAMRAEMGRLQKQNASLKRMHELGWANRDCPVCGAAVSSPIDNARRGAP